MLQEATAKIDEYARGMISGSGSTLFEELGLYYIGPIDGHNLDDLIAILQGMSLPFRQFSSLLYAAGSLTKRFQDCKPGGDYVLMPMVPPCG